MYKTLKKVWRISHIFGIIYAILFMGYLIYQVYISELLKGLSP